MDKNRRNEKTPYNIRKFKPDDTDEIVNLYIDTYSKEPWLEEWQFKYAKLRISDLTTNPSSICYVITDDIGKIAGGLFGRRNVYINSLELFIDEFFISPNFQNRGFGSKLIDYVADEIKKSGYSCIILNTERDFPSESFYRKNHFKIKKSNIFMYKSI